MSQITPMNTGLVRTERADNVKHMQITFHAHLDFDLYGCSSFRPRAEYLCPSASSAVKTSLHSLRKTGDGNGITAASYFGTKRSERE